MKHLRDKQLALNGSKPGELCVMATGGGAYKFYDEIRDALGVDVLREDEMECLIIGEQPQYLDLFCWLETNQRAGLQVSISSLQKSHMRSLPIPRRIPCTL
jgi:hypothetical protein